MNCKLRFGVYNLWIGALSKGTLKPFSYVVLALIGEGGAGAHDVAAWMGEARIYWASAPSQWYAEPKRLNKLGYLSSRELPGKTHARTHYLLTPKGRAALRGWLSTPASFPRIQNEAAIRLLAGDMLDDVSIIESLKGMLAEMEEIERAINTAISRAPNVPKRAQYLRLCHSWAKRLLDLHRDWITEVEKSLLPGQARTRSIEQIDSGASSG